MRHGLFGAGLVLGWLLIAAPASAQVFDWRAANRETAAMLRTNRWAEVGPAVERALASCPAAATPLDVGLCTAIMSENLGEVLSHQGDLAGAEAALRRCIEARAGVLPPNHPLMGEAYTFLAIFYAAHNRRADEAAAHAFTVAIARQGGPSQRQALASALSRQGVALTTIPDHAAAIPLFQEALTLFTEQQGVTSVSAQITLSNLALSQIAAGEPDLAFERVVRVIAGPDGPQFDATRRASLIVTAADASADKPALISLRPLLEVSAAQIEAGTLTDPFASFGVLRTLGNIAMAEKDGDGAVRIARQARTLAIAAWGEKSWRAVQAFRAEGAAEDSLQHYPTAVALYGEAIARADAPTLILERAGAQVDRSNVLTRVNGIEQARSELRSAVDGLAARTDVDPAYRVAALAAFGPGMAGVGDFDSAGRVCADAQARLDGGAKLSVSQTVAVALCTADFLLASSRFEEALTVGFRARAMLWAGLSPDRGRQPPLPTQRHVADVLSAGLRESGRLDEALVYAQAELALDQRLGVADGIAGSFARVASIQRRLGHLDAASASIAAGLDALAGTIPSRRAELISSQGLILLEQQRPSDAIAKFEEALSIRRAGPEGTAFVVAETESNLATALTATGRNGDAGEHLEVAVALYRELGPLRRPFLNNLLLRRASAAVASGDLVRAEAAFREAMTLEEGGASGRSEAAMSLSALLDRTDRSVEASGLRQSFIAGYGAKHDADAPTAQQLASPVARQPPAPTACDEANETLWGCLTIQARQQLASGQYAEAGRLAARATEVADRRWGADSAALIQPLLLQARVAAAATDPGAVARYLDGIEPKLAGDPATLAWLDLFRGQLLTQAGAPEPGEAALRAALSAGQSLNIPEVQIPAAERLAERLVDQGMGDAAIALWRDLQSTVDRSPTLQVAALESLADTSLALGNLDQVIRLCAAAESVSRTADGLNTARHRRLLVREALARAATGDAEGASRTLAPLAASADPEVIIARQSTLAGIAELSSDAATAVVHRQQVLRTAESAYGDQSVAAAIARLGLIEAQLRAGAQPDTAGLERIAAQLREAGLGWTIDHQIEITSGFMAAEAGNWVAAAAAFERAESLAIQREGRGSVSVAFDKANRGLALLQSGDDPGARALLADAMAISAPAGQKRNLAWARIAEASAMAAEATGDTVEAGRLHREAAPFLPRAALPRQRWL